MNVLKNLKKTLSLGLIMGLAACSSDTSFNLQSDGEVFQQSVTRSKVKVDILWVIDNSGSMETSQENVAANFQAFINKFQETNFDYQIAVTTTEAWRAPVDSNDDLARFRDGTPETSFSGVKVINPETPNLEDTFITNMKQGTIGSGDERGWQSLKESLSLQANLDEPFPREESILAIIFLTDEDDFSHDGIDNVSGLIDPYANPDLHDPMDYYDFLYDLTKSTEDKNNFIVNTIGIWDEECRSSLNTTFTGRKIATRYEAVTEASGGYKGSLCDDFSGVLAGISDTIIQKTTSFALDRKPADGSVVVKIDGEIVPNDGVNGWTLENEIEIVFHGSYVHGSDAQVEITFDPAGLK